MRRFNNYGPSLIVLATALLVLLAGPAAIRQMTFAQTQARVIQASQRLQNSTILEEINRASRDIAEMVEPSVVHITAQRLGRNNQMATISSGSGWIWDEDGHIVTNYHVIEGAQRIQVQLHSGVLREAVIVGEDAFTDIAVIRIPTGQLIPATRVEPDPGRPLDDVVQQGDLVFAFGSPFDFRFSMSSGVVSGKGRSAGVIRDRNGQSIGYENFIQVDAAINPGNSGGPLTNHRGEVIGMNTAIATGRNSDRDYDEGQFGGIGLAIPMSMIESAVDQLIETGEVAKGFIGVNAVDISADLMPELNRRGFVGKGVRVTRVHQNGPARRAGVRTGDIITNVNGQSIDSMNQLRAVISSMLPGEVASVTIWRYDWDREVGEEIEIPISLTEVVAGIDNMRLSESDKREFLGLLGLRSITTSTRFETSEREIDYHGGVIVDETVKGSDLADVLPHNSIIIEVMDQPVRSEEEFISQVLRLAQQGNRPRISAILPDGTRADVTIDLR